MSRQPARPDLNLRVWSIGMFCGESPLRLGPCPYATNPVLTARDVSDVHANSVADPFILRDNGNWYMFFEVVNMVSRKGEIGLARSQDGWKWTYERIVLREPFHLSYPFVFEFAGDHYMVPETLGANAIRLYKANAFPTRWSLVTTLVPGTFADPTMFRFDGRWWLFACPRPLQHDSLCLYYSDDLIGPWRGHRMNPIVDTNKRMARPGGRVTLCESRIIRFAQDCYPRYGSSVRAMEIIELTPESYFEREASEIRALSPTGSGWNSHGMHHVDPQQISSGEWIASVDGLEISRLQGLE